MSTAATVQILKEAKLALKAHLLEERAVLTGIEKVLQQELSTMINRKNAIDTFAKATFKSIDEAIANLAVTDREVVDMQAATYVTPTAYVPCTIYECANVTCNKSISQGSYCTDCYIKHKASIETAQTQLSKRSCKYANCKEKVMLNAYTQVPFPFCKKHAQPSK
jgi:hypothetical protein